VAKTPNHPVQALRFFNFFTLKRLGVSRSWQQNIDGFISVTGQGGAIQARSGGSSVFIRSAGIAPGCFDYRRNLIFDLDFLEEAQPVARITSKRKKYICVILCFTNR